MKKFLVLFLIFGMFTIMVPNVKASTINDLYVQIQALQKQIVNLQSQMSALVLRAEVPTVSVVNQAPLTVVDSDISKDIVPVKIITPAPTSTLTTIPAIETALPISKLVTDKDMNTIVKNTNIAPDTKKINTEKIINTIKKMTLGSKSSDVLVLQKILIKKGLLKKELATGYYGTATAAAVSNFQKANKLYVDGVAGKSTIAAINLLTENLTTNPCDDLPVDIYGNVSTAPLVKILSPNGGEVYQPGQQITVKWQSCNVPANTQIQIGMNWPSSWNLGFNLAAVNTTNTGSLLYTLPAVSNFYSPEGFKFGQYFKIVVSAPSLQTGTISTSDMSDDWFSINEVSPSAVYYGMTPDGGTNNYGTIFKWSSSLGYVVKYNFDGINGATPKGALTKYSDGNFYGMTYAGGLYGYGTIFQYNPITNVYTNKLNFNYSNGANPIGSLILGTDGDLYGVTSHGGGIPQAAGVIFKYNPTTNTYTLKYSIPLPTGTSGYPVGSLVQGEKGTDQNFYGLRTGNVCANGLGGCGFGDIYQWNPVTNIFTVKYSFNGTHGGNPQGSLFFASDGNFYGTTLQDGANNFGVIFQWNPNTNTYVDKYDFNFNNGSHPLSSLVQGFDGKLYGTTKTGGTYGAGVLFKYDPILNVYAKYDFEGTNGSLPEGSLVQDPNGSLYGVTVAGGGAVPNTQGTIFQFNPVANTVIRKHGFNGIQGSGPVSSLVFY